MENHQYRCQRCRAVVVVQSLVLLDTLRQAAWRAGLCLDCFGRPKIKYL